MPTGKHTTSLGIIAAAVLFCLSAAPQAAAQQIGAARIVVNQVTGTPPAAQPVTLRAGIDVVQNEIIDTAASSACRVVFQDNTELSVGASSQVKLDRFVFDPNPSKSAVAISMAKGVARFSTGLLPKENYQITTPGATIGIRGTVLMLTVSARGVSTISVESGSAYVTGAGRTVTVLAGQSTLVVPGSPPTTPVATPPSPPITIEMDRLLQAANEEYGTRAPARSSPATMPQGGGNTWMLSPNIDPKIQSEIAGDETPPGFPGSGGSKGTHGPFGAGGSKGTHGGTN
ncbi:MAG TPA: FecR domain-containing protein [Stellaceae bacterium]|nr:FecR domain-containing protein [Stellaceae bacterium]